VLVPVEVSVVIPTHDRPAGLARLLDALRGQTIDPRRFEAIVVDDGSRQPASVQPDGLRMLVLRHERARGPAAARNSGWREAQGDVVAFIDDDCTPHPGWLEALLRSTDGPNAVLQGPVAPMPDQARHPLSHTIEVGGPTMLFISANIAYPRSLLARLGGFDERFRRACGEDAELGARATKAGALVRFVPDALVYHEVRDLSLAEHIRHTLKWTDAVGALAIHPELRRMLILGVFWKPTHPWLIGGAAALAVRRPRVAAVALVPYFLRYARIYGGDLDRLIRALPRHLVIDASEIVTALIGSARHGTLML
jgi:glycosyltransferase involved in cell wall biosynthesis